VNLEHIIDDELTALCRARNLTASTGVEHCIIPILDKWEVMTVDAAARQAMLVRDYHIAKVRRTA